MLQPFDLDSEENPSFMAWNYYPPVTTEEQEAFKAAHGGKLPPRLHAHADMDVLTILFQRVGKLRKPVFCTHTESEAEGQSQLQMSGLRDCYVPSLALLLLHVAPSRLVWLLILHKIPVAPAISSA